MVPLYRKQLLTFFTTIILISIYFLMNIGSDISVKNYLIYANLEENQKSSEIVSQIANELLNSTISEIQFRVKETDEYLRRLSANTSSRPESRLIYPKEVLEMTKITINQMPCSGQYGKDIALIVMVFNRPDAFDRRKTIRETWGQAFKRTERTRIYFAVGLTRDVSVQKKLIRENNKFRDILQFGYYEDYYNCTIKAIGLLRWTALNCPFAKYMLKVDDDSLVLPNNLLEYCRTSEADSISGYLWQKPGVRRGSDKWSISVEDYPQSYYPDYIAGPYLIPGVTALTLYETAVTECLPALPFEDVYIAGIVANKRGIDRKHLSSLLYLWNGCNPRTLDYCFYRFHTIFWQQFDDQSIRKVWNDFQSETVCKDRGQQKC